MTKRILTLGLSSGSLLLLLACGGGGGGNSTPLPTATAIAYTNPTAVPPTSYYLNKNIALSAPGSHLVLELFGPAAVTGSGVVLTLNLDTTRATWANTPVVGGGQFTANAFGAPILKHKLSGTSNGTLQVVITERGVASAKAFTAPLLQFALDLKPGQSIGSVISLTPDLTKSKVLLPGMPDPSPMLDLRTGSLATQ